MGINYLALNDLFKITWKREDVMKYKVRVQMVEIYNEQVRDLLSEDTSTIKYPLFCVFFILFFVPHTSSFFFFFDWFVPHISVV